MYLLLRNHYTYIIDNTTKAHMYVISRLVSQAAWTFNLGSWTDYSRIATWARATSRLVLASMRQPSTDRASSSSLKSLESRLLESDRLLVFYDGMFEGMF